MDATGAGIAESLHKPAGVAVNFEALMKGQSSSFEISNLSSRLKGSGLKGEKSDWP